jgi:hypothetical protein
VQAATLDERVTSIRIRRAFALTELRSFALQTVDQTDHNP